MDRLADYPTGDLTNSFLTGLDVCDYQRIVRRKAEKAVRMVTKMDWDWHAALLLSAQTYLSALDGLWRKARRGAQQKAVASVGLDSPVNTRCCIVSRRSIRKHAAILAASIRNIAGIAPQGQRRRKRV
jgi:hypothetical protein